MWTGNESTAIFLLSGPVKRTSPVTGRHDWTREPSKFTLAKELPVELLKGSSLFHCLQANTNGIWKGSYLLYLHRSNPLWSYPAQSARYRYHCACLVAVGHLMTAQWTWWCSAVAGVRTKRVAWTRGQTKHKRAASHHKTNHTSNNMHTITCLTLSKAEGWFTSRGW